MVGRNLSDQGYKDKAYQVQVALPQVFVLGTLFIMSLMLSFYLGWVTAKGKYPIAEQINIETTKAVNSEVKIPEELNFFELGVSGNSVDETQEKLEHLKEKTEAISAPTEVVALKPESKLPIEAPPETPPAPVSTPKTNSVEQRVVAETKKAVPPHTGEYTVQVFSSQKQSSAKDVVRRLKEKGFDASIFSFINASHQTLYRVRTGRMDRATADKQASQLEQLDFIGSVQVTRF